MEAGVGHIRCNEVDVVLHGRGTRCTGHVPKVFAVHERAVVFQVKLCGFLQALATTPFLPMSSTTQCVKHTLRTMAQVSGLLGVLSTAVLSAVHTPIEDNVLSECMTAAMQAAGLDPTSPDWNCGGSVMSPTCLDKTHIAARQSLACVQEYSTAKQLKVFSMEALSTPTQSKATYECLYEKMKTCGFTEGEAFCKDTHSCLEQVRCVMTQFNLCMGEAVWPVDQLKSEATMTGVNVRPFNDCVEHTARTTCGRFQWGAASRHHIEGSACAIGATFDCGLKKGLFPFFTSDAVPVFKRSASPECVTQSHAACLNGATFCSHDTPVDVCLSQLKCTLQGINQCADYKFVTPELIPTGMLTDVDCLSSFDTLCRQTKEHTYTFTTRYNYTYHGAYHERTFDPVCAASKALYCTTAKPAMEKLKTDLKECVSQVKECGFDQPPQYWACAKMQGNSAMTTGCYKMSSCALRSATQCINDAMRLTLPHLEHTTISAVAPGVAMPVLVDTEPLSEGNRLTFAIGMALAAGMTLGVIFTALIACFFVRSRGEAHYPDVCTKNGSSLTCA